MEISNDLSAVDLPKISVITVVYNGIDYIEKTINSVLSQDYPNLEYIIIDGGSSDGTLDIIKKYQNRISYWISERDGGIYFAMNKGIMKATGEWIHFRNCGDYFFSDTIISELFNNTIDSEVIILHGDCRFIFSNKYEDRKPLILTKSINKGMPIYHPSAFIRTAYHKNNLYNTKYRSSSDYEFFYKAISNGCKTMYKSLVISTYNSIDGFSLKNWKIERKEIWEWRYPNTFFKPILVWFDILILGLRKKAIRVRSIINKLKCF